MSYAADPKYSSNDMVKILDHMFEKVDFNTIPTGLLRDFAVEDEDLDLYTGTKPLDAENCVTGIRFLNLVNTVNSLSCQRNVLSGMDKSVKNYQYQTDEVPVCVLLYKYSQIKSDALTKKRISYSNGQVELMPSDQSPFQQDYIFAGCGINRKLHTPEAILSIPCDLLFSNCDIKEFRIDYGQGLTKVNLDDRIPVTLQNGQNDILLEVILTDGTLLRSHTNVYVEQAPTETGMNKITPIPMPKVTHFTGDPYKGISTSATVSICYGRSNGKIHTKLVKTFIFVEGFDPRCLNPENFGNMNFYTIQKNPIITNLLDEGFDIVYIDWDNSEEFIQANANTLIKILDYINNEKRSSQPDINNVIMGYSMGGLIARYALRKMELEDQYHGVTHFISYDSPHLGAQIPIGVLYGFYGIKKFIESRGLLTALLDIFADIDIPNLIELGESIAYSNAAKQMLIQYVDPAGNLNNDEHLTWQRELNAMGMPIGDPRRPINLFAVAHGSYSKPQEEESYLFTSLDAGSEIILGPLGPLVGLCLNDVIAGLLGLLPGRTSLEGEVGIYLAYKYSDTVTNINLRYRKKLLWMLPITHTVYSYQKTSSPGPRYESFPSSVYSLTDNLLNNSSQELDFGVVAWVKYGVKVAEQIPFIPTSSALAVGDGININSSDYLVKPEIGKSAFGENYYVLPTVTPHSDINYIALNKIVSRITTKIEGPTLAKTGSKYTLNQGIIEWSTSDPSIATIDDDGVLNATGKGIVSIIAKSYPYYDADTFSKDIIVGTPRFVLKGKQEPGGYNVTAECIDEVYVDKLDNINSCVSYQWGIKYADKDIIWMDEYKREVNIPLEIAKDCMSVYFQMTDPDGNSSQTLSLKTDVNDIYSAYNNFFYIDSSGNLYKANKSKVHYDVASIYFDYIEGIDEQYKERKWMPTSAEICGLNNLCHTADISGFRLLFRDMMNEEEFNQIKTDSDDGNTYTYFLVLQNSAKQPIQLLPITIMYKTQL